VIRTIGGLAVWTLIAAAIMIENRRPQPGENPAQPQEK